MILTEAQIRTRVRSIRRKANRTAMAFALRSDGPWSGPSTLTIDKLPHRVAFCRSDLELRELLRAAGSANEPLVALCPFDGGQLGEDVLARLAKRRVHPLEPMEIITGLFQASSVDSRILANPSLVDALVEHAPPDGYPPVVGGVLDLQTAWREAIGRMLGDRDGASDISRLLEVALDGTVRSRLEKMPGELRHEFFAWAEMNVDRSAAWMACLVQAGKAADLVPFGLLLELAFDPALHADPEVAAARVRTENWFSGQSIDAGAVRSWVGAARATLASLQRRSDARPTVAAILSRFDALLVEFKIPDLAVRSDFSPAGFEQRVRAFAAALDGDLKTLSSRLAALQTHALADEQQDRIERCRMAARLAHWLADGAKLTAGPALEEAIAGYARLGGFVDWARTTVQENDTNPNLNKAYDVLTARVEAVCAEFEAAFAARFAEWTSQGSPPGGSYLPVEDALEKLVGPLGAQVPVLLLVMDGMSVAVFRELLGDILEHGGWLECQPGGLPLPTALLATVPSVTEISRRALLRGKLQPGSTPTEQSAFSANDRLFSLCGGQVRPVLFLKGDLQTSGESGLAPTVKEAVQNKKCRVVATVLNAVDDHLDGSDQIAARWSQEAIRPLDELLRIAAEVGRAVLFTSDHGHVLEHHTILKSGAAFGGDRYRGDAGPPVDGEVRFTGARIEQATGHPSVVAAWSRHLRYANKKRGYHGGVNPMEAVIPLTLLVHRSHTTPDGWKEVVPSPYWPDWWRFPARQNVRALSVAAPPPVTKAIAGLELFAHAAAWEASAGWIDQLLDGDVYAQQCSLGARGGQDKKRVATVLELLSSKGGSVPREMLAERLGLPLLRVNGVVADLARVFNVDGYDVLNLDSTSGIITLNVALLKKQFAIAD